ncbi:MAG: nitroreductase family protein [Clostridiales bacterium]|jgi:nitroreductase|nr:nitroreductase family protein [Clostridiales bacterium]
MNALETIFSRKSVREFADRPISDEALDTILRAGMSGPSCVNARDGAFLVARGKETLNRMADANGKPAEPLRRADAGVLVCGDLGCAFARAKDYWIIDGAIAAQNMVLAAWSMGIGSVWLGTYPQMDRVEALGKLFALPESVIPHSIIAFGYPAQAQTAETDQTAETVQTAETDHWEASRLHFETWQ